MNSTRLLFLFIPLLTGCANERSLHVTGPYPDSPIIKRCLERMTSVCSTNATNHYFVGAVKPDYGFIQAFIYWKEERTIIEYCGLSPDAPDGAEFEAFHHELKLYRDTVDTPEDMEGSNYLVTDREWVDWMEGCISHGTEYVIPLEEARRLFP